VRDCNVCAKLYVGECMLTIGLNGMFGSPYSLNGRGFVGFNVDWFTGNVIFFHQDLSVLHDC